MSKVKLEQILATEKEQLQKLNEIVQKAIEEEKLLCTRFRNNPTHWDI